MKLVDNINSTATGKDGMSPPPTGNLQMQNMTMTGRKTEQVPAFFGQKDNDFIQ